ncbi:hypothetical protein IFM89_026019 [Coptis chinensis]|uniref:RNase H type-1 domain-containing protein n=1 Tax=Coptis chinensis TaxID=261450 RepID=A0A835HJY0_9MAGN|nr:hypothetical protein IFM89_026019 [Coptis chinensis]
MGFVKANTDGSTLGNPGYSVAGVIFRGTNAELLGVLAHCTILWKLQARWKIHKLDYWYISHTYREVNLGADTVAKQGATLTQRDNLWSSTRPNFITKLDVLTGNTIDLVKS